MCPRLVGCYVELGCTGQAGCDDAVQLLEGCLKVGGRGGKLCGAGTAVGLCAGGSVKTSVLWTNLFAVELPHFPCSMFGITDQEQLPFHVALSWNDRFSLRLFSEFYVWSRQGLGRVQETGGGEHAHQAKIITGTLFGTLLIGG